jgi:hypothetical protein
MQRSILESHTMENEIVSPHLAPGNLLPAPPSVATHPLHQRSRSSSPSSMRGEAFLTGIFPFPAPLLAMTFLLKCHRSWPHQGLTSPSGSLATLLVYLFECQEAKRGQTYFIHQRPVPVTHFFRQDTSSSRLGTSEIQAFKTQAGGRWI